MPSFKTCRLRIEVLCLAFLQLGLSAQLECPLAADAKIIAQVSHSDEIKAVAFSPNGERVLSGGEDRTIKLWDVATGSLLRTFPGHPNGVVTAVAFSPDGMRVFSGASDKHVTIWDAMTGQAVRTLGESYQPGLCPDCPRLALAVSPDGLLLVSSANTFDGGTKLFDALSGRVLKDLNAYDVDTLAFARDGKRIVSGDPKFVKVWDAATGQLVRSFHVNSGEFNAVSFSANGREVLSASAGLIQIWRAESGQLVRTQRINPKSKTFDPLSRVVFSPDGHKLASYGISDSDLKIWDVASGRLLRILEAGSKIPSVTLSKVASVTFSPDGMRVLAGSGRDLKLWDVSSGEILRNFEGRAHPINAIAVSPDGSHLVSGENDGVLKVWDTSSGQLVQTLSDGNPSGVTSVVYSSDGYRLLSGHREILDGAKLWDMNTGKLLRTFDEGVPQVVGFSHDGRQAFTLAGPSLKVWDAVTGIGTPLREATMGIPSTVALSGDGKYTAFCDLRDEAIKVQATETGRLVSTLRGPRSCALSLAFSPDGLRLASSDLEIEDTLKIWDIDTSSLLGTLAGHSGWAKSMVFSANHRQLLSGGMDQTLKLWDTDTGYPIQTFKGHTGKVNAVAFSRDQLRVISGSADGLVKVWNTGTGVEQVSLLGSSGREWLAITPEGFFASSLNVSEDAHIVRGFTVYDINQVFQSLYSPDLVRESIGGDPKEEVKNAAKLINLESILDSGPAPDVEIMSVSQASSTSPDLFTVGARIVDRGRGVGRVEWRVNGITAAVTSKPEGSGPNYAVTQEVALDYDDNLVELVAYNGPNLLASVPARRRIRFTGSPDQNKPKLHILAIGINKYVDRGWVPPGRSEMVLFRPLNLAVSDATSVAIDLKRAAGAGYADVNVRLISNEEATREGVERAVNKLAAEIHPRDTFIFFAAGHGISEDGHFYLIPQDYQGGPGALARNAIDQDRLQDWFANRIKAKKAVILLDTCESGALVAGHMRSRTDSDAAVGRLHEATGRPVLTAAALGQKAYEGVIAETGERHGVFTWAFLDALRHGDTNNDREIDLSELVIHIQNRVEKAELRGLLGVRVSLAGRQSARFGSRGENFVLVRRLE